MSGVVKISTIALLHPVVSCSRSYHSPAIRVWLFTPLFLPIHFPILHIDTHLRLQTHAPLIFMLCNPSDERKELNLFCLYGTPSLHLSHYLTGVKNISFLFCFFSCHYILRYHIIILTEGTEIVVGGDGTLQDLFSLNVEGQFELKKNTILFKIINNHFCSQWKSQANSTRLHNVPLNFSWSFILQAYE